MPKPITLPITCQQPSPKPDNDFVSLRDSILHMSVKAAFWSRNEPIEANEDRFAIIGILIEAGADLNFQNDNYEKPYHLITDHHLKALEYKRILNPTENTFVSTIKSLNPFSN